MERLFQILAVVLIGVAAFFLWNGNWDGVFISAVFGAVCFFLSIRFQVHERIKSRKAQAIDVDAEDERDAELDGQASAGRMPPIQGQERDTAETAGRTPPLHGETEK
jgi:hypothetical protein